MNAEGLASNLVLGIVCYGNILLTRLFWCNTDYVFSNLMETLDFDVVQHILEFYDHPRVGKD